MKLMSRHVPTSSEGLDLSSVQLNKGNRRQQSSQRPHAPFISLLQIRLQNYDKTLHVSDGLNLFQPTIRKKMSDVSFSVITYNKRSKVRINYRTEAVDLIGIQGFRAHKHSRWICCHTKTRSSIEEPTCKLKSYQTDVFVLVL